MAQGVSPLLSASAAIAGRIRFIRLLVFLITVVAGGAIADPPTEGSIRIGLIAKQSLIPLACVAPPWLVGGIARALVALFEGGGLNVSQAAAGVAVRVVCALPLMTLLLHLLLL